MNLIKALTFAASLAVASCGHLVPAYADDVSPVVQLGNSQFSFCTAFFVSPTTLLTAGHCVYDDPKAHSFIVTDLTDLQLLIEDATPPTDLIHATLVAASNPYAGMADWAILHIDPQDTPAGMTPLALDCGYVPAMLDDLTSEGFPHAQGGEMTHEKGYIDVKPGPLADSNIKIGTTMPVAPGASGGPLLKDGKVVGIVTDENAKQTAWSYSTPITTICSEVEQSFG